MMISEAIITSLFIAGDLSEYSVQDVIRLIQALLWSSFSFLAILKINNRGSSETVSYRIATKWERFIHFMVDSSVCILISMSYLGVSFKFNAPNLDSQLLIISVVNICYYFAFEITFGSTPGKFLTGTRVVLASNQKIIFSMGIVRTISRLIPFEVFSIFFGAFHWHDSISKTKVVNLCEVKKKKI